MQSSHTPDQGNVIVDDRFVLDLVADTPEPDNPLIQIVADWLEEKFQPRGARKVLDCVMGLVEPWALPGPLVPFVNSRFGELAAAMVVFRNGIADDRVRDRYNGTGYHKLIPEPGPLPPPPPVAPAPQVPTPHGAPKPDQPKRAPETPTPTPTQPRPSEPTPVTQTIPQRSHRRRTGRVKKRWLIIGLGATAYLIHRFR